MVKRTGLILIVFCAFVRAAAAQPPTAAPAATPAADEGIPVESELVRAKCGACHKATARADVAHLLPPRDAGKLGEDNQADGRAEPRRRWSRRTRARSSSIWPTTTAWRPKRRARSRSRPSAGMVEYTYTADKRHRGHLLVVPLDLRG